MKIYLHPAYWIAPDGTAYPVTRHIDFMGRQPDLFGLSRESYIACFRKHNEKPGFEGKARKELFIEAFKQGWIRVRHYINRGWTVELYRLDDKSRENLSGWARLVMDNKDKHDEFLNYAEMHIVKDSLAGAPLQDWLIITNLQSMRNYKM